MTKEKFAQIKRILRENAAGGPGQKTIDLRVPANRFSAWYDGPQGYLFKDSGEYLAAACELVIRYQMGDAVIFDAIEDRVWVLTCVAG